MLSVVVVLTWVALWWAPRQVRVGFALLAPVGSVGVLVYALTSGQPASCPHGCVLGWADSVDGSQRVAEALPTLPITLAIFVITVTVELVLFVRRRPGQPELREPDRRRAGEVADPRWSELFGARQH